MQRTSLALAVTNLVLMVLVLAHLGSATAQSDASVLRGRALELVDDQGRIRANMRVEPDGEVVLRLRDEAGTIRVKLAATRNGSGLVLLNDLTEPGVQILAGEEGSSVKLVNKGGREKLITP